MKTFRIPSLILCIGVTALVPGCTRRKSHNVRLQQKWNAKMKETADLLVGVTDVPSAKAAEPKLAAAMKELERLNEELEKSYDPEDVPPRDKDPMIEALAQGLVDFQRAALEVQRISKTPDLVTALGAAWQQLPGVVMMEAAGRMPAGK